MMTSTAFIIGLVAVVAAALIAFSVTPPVRVFAYKIGAIDVPKDDRRMHKKPIPRIGGLAIYAGFLVSTLVFCEINQTLISIWFGGLILVILGVLDDIYHLNAWIKLAVQIVAAVVPVTQGVVINYIWLGSAIEFGVFKYPFTILWIVGLTNAINLIDGLDGLACGVSAICSMSMFGVAMLMGDYASALLTAILVGACLGFMPYNRHPARIFMGDTGSLFLGYTLAIISVQGLFKTHAVLSFIMPIAVFALPLFDTLFAIIRRVLKGQSPFHPDRGHLHHKLVDMGFTQKETVHILYAISGLFGLVAITFSDSVFSGAKYVKTLIIVCVAIAVFVLNFLILKKPDLREKSGLFTDEQVKEFEEKRISEASGKEQCDAADKTPDGSETGGDNQ